MAERGFRLFGHEHVSALNPVTWPSPSVCNGDDLDMSDVHETDDEEWETAQQKTSGVADVRRRSFGSVSDQLNGSIKLASKTRRAGTLRSRYHRSAASA